MVFTAENPLPVDDGGEDISEEEETLEYVVFEEQEVEEAVSEVLTKLLNLFYKKANLTVVGISQALIKLSAGQHIYERASSHDAHFAHKHKPLDMVLDLLVLELTWLQIYYKQSKIDFLRRLEKRFPAIRKDVKHLTKELSLNEQPFKWKIIAPREQPKKKEEKPYIG